MNTKAVAGIVVVVVVIAAIAAFFVLNNNDDDQNKGFVGVVYDGNGGTYDGSTSYRLTSTTVQNNAFTNNNYSFVSWNTKADGTGTSYKPGDTISYPEHGYVTLYAQWSTEKVYSISEYSEIIGTPVMGNVALYLDGYRLTVGSASQQVSGNEIIMIQSTDKCTDWTWNEEQERFDFKIDGASYFLKITVTGAENATGFMSNGIPCYGFTVVGNVGITVATGSIH